jgi:transposase-like protein
VFRPVTGGQRYCSLRCAGRGERSRRAQIARRTVERPPAEQLLREVAELGYLAVGRRYGVSDNAIRQWCRAYERERGRERISSAATAEPSHADGTPP